MTVTVTEQLTSGGAGKTSVIFPVLFFEERWGFAEGPVLANWPRAALWVNLVPGVREEDLSFCNTEIVFPEATEVFVPRTPIGEKLLSLRVRAIQAGMTLLSADGVLEEVRRRRGKFADDEADVC